MSKVSDYPLGTVFHTVASDGVDMIAVRTAGGVIVVDPPTGYVAVLRMGDVKHLQGVDVVFVPKTATEPSRTVEM